MVSGIGDIDLAVRHRCDPERKKKLARVAAPTAELESELPRGVIDNNPVVHAVEDVEVAAASNSGIAWHAERFVLGSDDHAPGPYANSVYGGL